jgi:hypothetical protein
MAFLSNISLKPYLSRCDNGSLYVYTSRIIPELAVLGHTDVAGRLLSRLNSFDFYHDQHGRYQALWFLWDLRAKEDGVPWPEGEEEKVRQAVRQRRAKIKRTSNGAESQGPVTSDDMQRELDVIAQDFGSKWYYPSHMSGSDRVVSLNPHRLDHPPSICQLLDSARDIIHSFETAHPAPKIRDVRSGLVSALDLVLSAEVHHEKGGTGETLHLRGAPTSAELLSWLAQSLGDEYYENRPVTESRQAWKLYKRGALRRQLNVDEAALTAFAEDFENALTERLTNGRSRPAANLSIPELLKAVEHNAQINPKAQETYHEPHDSSLFHTPATEQQIKETETRLNTTLPSDYTTFLRLSNGFGSAWSHPLDAFQPPLHPVDKLRWLDPTSEDYFTDLTLDMPTRWDKWPFAPAPTTPSNYSDAPEHFLIGRALEIGTEGIDNTWLLPPSTVIPIKCAVKNMLDDENLGVREKGSVRAAVRDFAGSEEGWEGMEWACVTWASGGVAAMYVYEGFTAYLADLVGKGQVGMEGEAKKVVQGGMWLGKVFGKTGIEEVVGGVPGWLRDAMTVALPTRRGNLVDKV